MKKWYERLEWNKILEPIVRWGAIVLIAAIAPTATAIFAGADTSGTGSIKTAYTEPEGRTEPATKIDSLGKCIREIKTDISEIKSEMKARKSVDSVSFQVTQDQYKYVREDIADIKRFLMGRNLASR